MMLRGDAVEVETNLYRLTDIRCSLEKIVQKLPCKKGPELCVATSQRQLVLGLSSDNIILKCYVLCRCKIKYYEKDRKVGK